MEQRSLNYIAQATAGELIGGSPEQLVCRVCTDSRQAEPGDLFVALAGERFDAHAFLPQVVQRGVAAVVVEQKKIPAGLCGCGIIAVDNSRHALGRLAAHYRSDFALPIIAVGGSNGKTSTKELIASVLRQKMAALWSEASFNNDIGVPLSLLKLDRSHQAAVLEAGTNHPGELAPLLRILSPNFGVVTNIGREHLEFFGDLAGVALEEGTMAESLPAEATLFLNGDDEWSPALARRTRARVLRVGLDKGNDCVAENVRFDQAGVTFWVTSPFAHLNGEYRLQLLGRHHVTNALLAFAVGATLGLSREEIERGLATCQPAKSRLQLSVIGGIRVLDDSYNANADSMLAALKTLRELPCAGRRIAVLGDMVELGGCSSVAHQEVGRQCVNAALDQLFTVGTRAWEIAGAARAAGMEKICEFSQVEEAAEAVKAFARSGDLVLIKASRAMRLERVAQALRSAAGQK